MTTWRKAMRDGLITGSVASIVSTIALGLRGGREDDDVFGPANAISHWVWGDEAFHRNGPSMRYTLTGYAIHHASAALWAVIYEKWFSEDVGRESFATAAAGAATVGALACFADYNLVPKRLRPGYERRLSSTSMFVGYTLFAASLPLRALVSSRCGNRSTP